jgi:hypothetical protein
LSYEEVRMDEFEQKLINDCYKRLIELDNEKEQIYKFMKALGWKKPRRRYKRRAATVAMPELDAHRQTRLSVVTTKPLTKDEARKVVKGDVTVAAQT